MENQEKVPNITPPLSDNSAPKSATNNKIASVVIVILVAIVGFLLLKDSTPPEPKEDLPVESGETGTTTGIEKIRSISADEHILGNPNAKVFVVEYSDTECPFCKMFHNTMHEVISEQENVAWVYRHFPIEQLHQKAFKESLAMECAWEQGGNEMFWMYTDQIYVRTNSNDSLPDEEIYNIANELGLNMEQFSSCVDTQKYASKVESDLLDGRIGGVEGTPTSFVVVDNQVVNSFPGASPKETVLREIERALR